MGSKTHSHLTLHLPTWPHSIFEVWIMHCQCHLPPVLRSPPFSINIASLLQVRRELMLHSVDLSGLDFICHRGHDIPEAASTTGAGSAVC